jgi:hypothetical protein
MRSIDQIFGLLSCSDRAPSQFPQHLDLIAAECSAPVGSSEPAIPHINRAAKPPDME